MTARRALDRRPPPRAAAALVLGLLAAPACHHQVAFVSDRGGADQLYRMRWKAVGAPSPSTSLLSPGPARRESYPDVSPDGTRVAFRTAPATGSPAIATRDLADTTGATEVVLVPPSPGSPDEKRWPRWSCQQDLVAYAAQTSNHGMDLFVVAAGGGAPVPLGALSGYGFVAGLDFLDHGNLVVFAQNDVRTGSLELALVPSDGSRPPVALTSTPQVAESLPVASHDQRRVAYLATVALTPGDAEQVVVADATSWAVLHRFTPPGPTRAIDFAADDQRLYLAAEAADVAGSGPVRLEVWSVALDGSDRRRLTDNAAFDGYPSAIPTGRRAPCTRCARLGGLPASGPADEIRRHGVRLEAAALASGARPQLEVRDYCPAGEGTPEVRVPASPPVGPSAHPARILFPAELHGAGPSHVEVTACTFNALRLEAYDAAGGLVAEASLTGPQGQARTVVLEGRPIARIDLVGAEIGLGEICTER